MSDRPPLINALLTLTVAVVLAGVAYGGGNLIALLSGFVLSSLGIELRPRHLVVLSVVTIQIVAFCGVSLVYLRYRGWTLRDIGVRWPGLEGWVTAGAGYIGVLILWGVATVVTIVVVSRYGIEQPQQQLIRMGQEDPMVFVLLAVLSILIVGPAEELLFRGVVQTRIREYFGVGSGLTLATLLFAVIHLPGYANASIVSALLGVGMLFFVGSILAITYEYTGNLVVPAIIHGLFNATQGALGYFSSQFSPDTVASILLLGIG